MSNSWVNVENYNNSALFWDGDGFKKIILPAEQPSNLSEFVIYDGDTAYFTDGSKIDCPYGLLGSHIFMENIMCELVSSRVIQLSEVKKAVHEHLIMFDLFPDYTWFMEMEFKILRI